MAEPRAQHWFVECHRQQLLEALGTAFALTEGPTSHQTLDIRDTFGWAIWHSGAVFSHDPQTARFCLQQDSGNAVHGQSSRSTPTPRFWWDFDESDLRHTLRGITGLWAIDSVATLELDIAPIILRDDEGKIVVRGQFTDHRHAGGAQCHLSLYPLRGFADDFNRAASCIQALTEPAGALTHRKLLREQNIQPRDLRDKRGFGLQPDMSTEVAIRRMALHMLERARLFEPGLIDDTDTEFLHQYRVSLRRTRSLLNLLKQALPATDQRFLKRELSRIAGRTGEMRDLDVLLLRAPDYRQMVPDEVQDGMDTLFALISAERAETFESVAAFLASTHYANEINAVLTNLRRPPTLAAPLAALPILRVASRKIHKRYRTIAAMAHDLARDAPDHAIHSIRIECKKLRYLMEFFAELYEKAPLGELVKSLKGLQDALGDFNDYSVQQNFLLDLATRHPDDTALGAAVGALIVVLQDRHQSARDKVETDLAEFAGPAVARRFGQLFGR